MKRSWIKLYLEIIGDPKMGRLSDHLWRRAIELFLLAGECGEDGQLPSVADMAWELRTGEQELTSDLEDLRDMHLVDDRVPGEWWVTNFAKRQARLTEAERASQYRAKRRHGIVTERVTLSDEKITERVTDASQGSVTDSSSTSTSSSDSDSSLGVRVQGEGWERIRRVYESDIGALTPMIAEALQADMREYGPDWVCAALEEAVRNEARNLKYAEAILVRWKRDGFQSVRKNGSAPASSNAEIIRKVAANA